MNSVPPRGSSLRRRFCFPSCPPCRSRGDLSDAVGGRDPGLDASWPAHRMAVSFRGAGPAFPHRVEAHGIPSSGRARRRARPRGASSWTEWARTTPTRPSASSPSSTSSTRSSASGPATSTSRRRWPTARTGHDPVDCCQLPMLPMANTNSNWTFNLSTFQPLKSTM